VGSKHSIKYSFFFFHINASGRGESLVPPGPISF
jgi:hypothetical protein